MKRNATDAMSELYDLYAPALFGVALRILGSETLAEDTLQDAFVKIWENSHQYDPRKGTLFTWMLNITRRTAIDKTRSAFYRREYRSGASGGPEDHAGSQMDWTPPIETIGLKGLVDSLDPKQREVIDLVYFQGFTQQEVQETLGIPLGTVKSRVRLAMQKLRKIFNDQPSCIGWLAILVSALVF